MGRIVNIKYRCCGYTFDAAVDCDWQLHFYGEKRNNVTPIELYNLDEDWDIRMIYQSKRNDQNKSEYVINTTCVDWDNLLKETRKWVREMRKK